MYINEKQIILASESERRKILLEEVGIDFMVMPSNFDEEKIPVSEPENYTIDLSKAKAKTVSVNYPDSWIIAADTIVIADKEILGKPKSRQGAFDMIKKLSGNVHTVYTGYYITSIMSPKN
jgi:septum formation protein